MPGHSHGFHELIIPTAGRMQVKIADTTLEAGVGDVLFYPAGHVHEEAASRQTPVATLFLSFTSNCGLQHLPWQVHDLQGRILEMARWLFDERDLAPQPGVQDQRHAILLVILRRYQFCAIYNPREDQLVRGIRALIRRNIDKPIDLPLLADFAQLSPFHFIRRYQQLTGRTPMADVRQIRLENARELILTTDLSLKHISRRCGLGSEYSFSRCFRRQFGYPPSQLRHHG